MTSTTKSIRPHYRLEAWKESMGLVKHVYQLTKEFPATEAYGLTSQMRRAAVSIPSNLAEGAARAGAKEFAQFLNVAKGSLSELETQILIAKDLGYIRSVEGLHGSCRKGFTIAGRPIQKGRRGLTSDVARKLGFT